MSTTIIGAVASHRGLTFADRQVKLKHPVRMCPRSRAVPVRCSVPQAPLSSKDMEEGRGISAFGLHLQTESLTWPLRFFSGATGVSGFGPRSTCDEVAEGQELERRVIMITGANSGIGREAARSLVGANAHVIAVARDVRKLDSLLEDVRTLPGRITPLQCNLDDPASIERLVKYFLKLDMPLHCLLNNAGVAFTKANAKASNGVELQFATNHMGTYLLTKGLLPKLKATGAPTKMARVINVSSCAHANGVVPTLSQVTGAEKVMASYGSTSEDPLVAMNLYSNTKLCNLLHSRWLNRILETEGEFVRAYSVHPGIIVGSDIWRHDALIRTSMKFVEAFNKSVQQGASTLVWAVTAADLEGVGGCYLVDNNVSVPHPKGCDMKEADRLVAMSEELIEMFSLKS
uniref:Protochlorophyllide reductase n=1 Tax=Pyramimonas obovata TaxID=1411642 RepID=A0A7S0WKU6_9CHLO|mmetsp:Transcript_28751/g.62984  ORF Transcript_28751/g.62984 Transcript_28751/m.62984 type:complete len:403 (+) Transcript_28751:31-1239(+)